MPRWFTCTKLRGSRATYVGWTKWQVRDLALLLPNVCSQLLVLRHEVFQHRFRQDLGWQQALAEQEIVKCLLVEFVA